MEKINPWDILERPKLNSEKRIIHLPDGRKAEIKIDLKTNLPKEVTIYGKDNHVDQFDNLTKESKWKLILEELKRLGVNIKGLEDPKDPQHSPEPMVEALDKNKH